MKRYLMPDGAPVFADCLYIGPNARIYQAPLVVIVLQFDFFHRLTLGDLL
jgi:hypothetical protein